MADDVAEPLPDTIDFTDPSPDPCNDSDLAVICDVLQEHAIERVAFEYSGSGDDGQIDEAEYAPESATLPEWVHRKLRTLAESYIPAGYEDNDGGHGMLTIFPFLGLAELEHHDNYTDAVAMESNSPRWPRGLAQRLTRAGVEVITANFDGYGDDGQIEDLAFEPATATVGPELQDAVERFLLDHLTPGWEIGEGSYGDFHVDVASRDVTVNGSCRVEQESDSMTRWRFRE
jgi:hypothetical protein